MRAEGTNEATSTGSLSPRPQLDVQDLRSLPGILFLCFSDVGLVLSALSLSLSSLSLSSLSPLSLSLCVCVYVCVCVRVSLGELFGALDLMLLRWSSCFFLDPCRSTLS